MTGSLFEPLDVSDPAVWRAVALLRTTGEAPTAEFHLGEGDPEQLIRGLAALAAELGGRYFGSLGAFLDALTEWQDTGRGPLRSP